MLPSFTRATSIELHISHLQFKLPPTGSFASLEQLTLFGGRFIDVGVLLPHCPHLRSLMMDHNCHGRGIKALTVESSSLDLLIWYLLDFKKPVDVHVVAPNLKNFVLSSFSRKFTMSLLAPKKELYVECYLEDSIVGCAENERWRLYELKLEMDSGIGMGSGIHD